MTNTNLKKESVFKNNDRNTLLVNPRFQLRFLGSIAAVAAVVILLIYAADFYFLWKFKTLAVDLALPPSHAILKLLSYQESMMLKVFIGLGSLIAMILGTFGMYFTNRVVGPMYRLTQHFLKDAKNGKWSKVRFRQNDFFQEVAAAYNQIGESANSKEKSDSTR